MFSLVSVILTVLQTRVFMAFWSVILVVSGFMCAGYFLKPKNM